MPKDMRVGPEADAVAPTLNVIWLPPLLLLALTTALGMGLWLSALNVEFRDVRYVVPFLVQFWLFVTPIAYPSSLLREPWRTLYGLNPMAGAVTSLYSIVTDARLHHRIEVVGGILADECAGVLQPFFAELRRGPTYSG